MQANSACPRCQQQISEERRRSNIIICDNCGCVVSNAEYDDQERSRKKFLRLTIGLSVVIFAAFIQICMWDSHALEVIPIKLREIMGTASVGDLEKMARICLERHKMECVEQTYAKLGQKDVKQLLVLGEFQMSHKRYSEAVNTYRIFFTKGGKDLKASFQFARALEQTGKSDEAAKYYKYILSARPDTLLQSATVHNYVRLLRGMRPEQAHRAIESVRRRSKMAAYLMDDEFKHPVADPYADNARGVASTPTLKR